MFPKEKPVDELLEELGTGIDGLTENEAQRRRRRYGPNYVAAHHPPEFTTVFLEQLRQPTSLLLIALAIGAFSLGGFLKDPRHFVDGGVMIVILLLSTIFTAWLNHRSEHQAHEVHTLFKDEITVRRAGTERHIPSHLLTVGDLFIVQTGDRVPADARIIESNGLHVDESVLTGESTEIRKESGDVYLNTHVTRGSALCVVTEVGSRTRVGRIARRISTPKESRFVREVNEASTGIARWAIGIIAFTATVLLIAGFSPIEIAFLSIALIVASVPESLPGLVSFSISRSIDRLSERNVLVKEPEQLESMGSVDVICFDKTGTLTQSRMRVERVILPDSNVIEASGLLELNEDHYDLLMRGSLLANDARITERGYVGSPADIALIDLFNSLDTDIIELRAHDPVLERSPHGEESLSVTTRDARFTKARAGSIIASATHRFGPRGVQKLSERTRATLEEQVHALTDESLRCVAISCRQGDRTILLAIFGLSDPLREDASAAVNAVRSAGLTVKIITGDNEPAARSVARQLGVSDETISWNTLKDLSEEQFLRAVRERSVFAHMGPEQKRRIIAALQAEGYAVAYAGDGVNDVLGLREADVALGVHAADLAEDASEILIRDGELSRINDTIAEGRAVFGNVRMVLNFLLSANFAELLVVLFASLTGTLPFTAIQILWLSLVAGLLPALALAGEEPDERDLARRPRGRQESLLSGGLLTQVLLVGIKKGGIALAIFLLMLRFGGPVAAQTTVFTWLVLSHSLRALSVRFENGRGPPSRALLLAIAVPILAQFVILFTPVSQVFGVTAIPLTGALLILLGALASISLAPAVNRLAQQIRS